MNYTKIRHLLVNIFSSFPVTNKYEKSLVTSTKSPIFLQFKKKNVECTYSDSANLALQIHMTVNRKLFETVDYSVLFISLYSDDNQKRKQ